MQTLFLQIESCGNPVMIKSVSAIFLTALAYFMSVRHILVILTIFQRFHYYYIRYGDL